MKPMFLFSIFVSADFTEMVKIRCLFANMRTKLTRTTPRKWPLAISILMWGITMNACATDTVKWKEEIVLHDGKKLIVTRSHTYGRYGEIGQGRLIAERTISFTVPGKNQTVAWKSDYGRGYEDNLSLLMLDFLNGTPYIATHPAFCQGYNKWGRPNPPYVFFKYDGGWKRIPLEEFPVEFKQANVVISTKSDEKQVKEAERETGFITAEKVKEINRGLEEHYLTIARSEVKTSDLTCEKLIYSNGKWTSPGGFKAPHPITTPDPTDTKK